MATPFPQTHAMLDAGIDQPWTTDLLLVLSQLIPDAESVGATADAIASMPPVAATEEHHDEVRDQREADLRVLIGYALALDVTVAKLDEEAKV